MHDWVATPACCAHPNTEPDKRFAPQPGPTSSRVITCIACGTLWVEEWTVLWIGDSDRDDFRYQRIDAAEAARKFPP